MSDPRITYILTMSYALDKEHQTIILEPGPHQNALLIDQIEELNEADLKYSVVRVSEFFEPREPSGEWRTEITIELVRPTIFVHKAITFERIQENAT